MGCLDRFPGVATVMTGMEGGTPLKYKRLPGRGPRKEGMMTALLSRCSLHLGEDHLLAVDSNGFSEDYKRFYFSDIQGFITRKTRRGFAWSIAIGLMLASFLTAALLLERDSVRIFFWALSALFLTLLLINLFRGPTCICHILTAVQEEPLPSLNRLRVARRVIDILRGVVERTQGELTSEDRNSHGSEEVNHPAPFLHGFRKARKDRRPARHDDATVHGMAFALILLAGLLTGILLLHHTPVLSGVSSVLTLLWSVLIIVALVRQYESDIPGSVRGIAWVSLGFLCLTYFLSYVLMISTLVANPQQQVATQWDIYRAMLNLSPQDSPFLAALLLFSAASSIALGSLGLLRVRKHRGDFASRPKPDRNSPHEIRV
jgi:hypothetical protein